MSAVAPILFPRMQRRGGHPGELSSLLATSSAMSETIPPSLVLITIGSVVPGLSIAALFTGGLLPALVAALALVAVAWWRSRSSDRGAGRRAPAAVMLRTFMIAVPVLTLPFVSFGPLLFSVAKAMGVHEVHYAMVVVLAMGIGLFAPPFGVGFYGACAIGRTNPDDSLWRIWPYIGALIISLLIVAAIPWL